MAKRLWRRAVQLLGGGAQACEETFRMAGLFVVVLTAGLVLENLRVDDRLDSVQFAELKAALANDPKNDALKEEIRALDVQLREAYFRHVERSRRGKWLLLCGLLVFLLSFKRRTAKAPVSLAWLKTQPTASRRRQSRWAVAGLGAACLGFMLVGAAREGREAGSKHADASLAVEKEAPEQLPAPEVIQRNWGRFRGPDGNGVAAAGDWPLAWNMESGEGILWKTPTALPGFNSPIVWEGKIYFSGATAERRAVYCYSTGSGQLLWEREVTVPKRADQKKAKVSDDTGFAASTMATDGLRVYAIFANGDLAAFTMDGGPVWAQNLGTPENPYGHATSLATWQGNVVVQMDQGHAEGKSRLILFNGKTGQPVWRLSRTSPSSWATPLIISHGGKDQIITLGEPWMTSYEAATGQELWRVGGLGSDLAPSPIYTGGLLIVASPWNRWLAVRPDGSGDVTESHVAWTSDEDIPDITSPASDGVRVFSVLTEGFATCFRAAEGAKLWEAELEVEINASPVIANGKVYFAGKSGVTVVIEAADEFRELSRNALGEEVYASPAFASGRVYIRSTAHLFAIGKTAPFATESGSQDADLEAGVLSMSR